MSIARHLLPRAATLVVIAFWMFANVSHADYIDFVGEYFSVKGSSIVPRSPQGQPLVAVTVTGDESFDGAARLGWT